MLELPESQRSIVQFDMCCTCKHAVRMGVMIQIRNVPETLHRELKSRAALVGMSLSDYLLTEMRQVAERPSMEQLRARLENRPDQPGAIATVELPRALDSASVSGASTRDVAPSV